MNRNLARALSLSAGLFCAAALAPGCADNQQSLFVRGVLAPSQSRTNGSCTWTDDPQQAGLFYGRLDIGLRDQYTAVLLVGNQLIGRGDPVNTRAESSRIQITGAIVRVTTPDGAVINEFTSTSAGFVDPQTNNQPGFDSISVTAIDPGTVAKLAGQIALGTGEKQVVTNIKVFGNTLGGDKVESGEFSYPIRLCNGCLVSFGGTDDPATPDVDCSVAASAEATAPCFFGQDEGVSCTSCQGLAACDPKLRVR